MKHLGQLVNEELPRDWGFVLLAFPFGHAPGRLNYVSNGNREDVLNAMKEFIQKNEKPDSFGKHL